MKKLQFLFIGIVLLVNANAQTPSLSWARSFSANATSNDSSSYMKIYNYDGSIYVLGTTDNFGSALDMILIKRSAIGDTLWTRRYDGTGNGNDIAKGMEIDQTNGDVYITGKCAGSGTGYDIVLLKCNSSGAIQWGGAVIYNNTYYISPTTYNSDDEPCGVGIDGSGHVFVAGTTFEGSPCLENVVVLAYSGSSGSLLVSRTYNEKYISSLAGSFNYYIYCRDFARKIWVSSSTGLIYISGETFWGGSSTSTMSFPFVFSLSLQGFSSNYLTQNINYLSTCVSNCGGFGSCTVCIPNQMEAHPYPNSFPVSDCYEFNYSNALFVDNANNVYVANVIDTQWVNTGSSYQIGFSKINSSGCILFDTVTTGRISSNYNDLGINTIKTDANNGNIYAVGYEKNASGNYDIILVKYDNSGVLQWKRQKNGSGNGNDIGYDLGFDSQQNPIITGKVRNSSGNDDVFIIRYNKTTGVGLDSVTYDSGNNDVPQNINVDANNSIIVNGYHNTSSQGTNILTLKYCSVTATAMATGPTTMCGSVLLNANPGTGLIYQWRKNGIPISGAINANYVATTNGSYKVVVTNSSGCTDSSSAINVTVYPKPTAGFTLNNSIQCLSGNSFVFNNTSSISSGTMTHSWDFGDQTTSTSLSPTKSYTAANNYTVRLVCTSNLACQDSFSTNIVINSVGINTISGAQASCASFIPSILTGTVPVSNGSPIFSGYKINEDFNGNLVPLGWNLSLNQNALLNSITSINSYGRIGTLGAIYANNFVVNSGYRAQLNTKTFTTTSATELLRFDVAHAAYPSSYYDSLIIYTSTGSGFTRLIGWASNQTIDSVYGITTAVAQTTSFLPTSTQWATKTLTLPVGTIQVRFEFYSDYGNQMYIDRVRIDSFSTPSPIYLWQRSITSSSVGYTTASGINNGQNYSPSLITQSTWFRRVVNSNGCSDSSNAIAVTVNLKPNVGFMVNNPMQVLSSGFTFTDTTNNSSSRIWNFGDGTFAVTSPYTKGYSNAGFYNVTLRVTNSFGCFDSTTKSITVLPNAPTISASSLTFSNITYGSMQLAWSNGNGQRRIVIAKAISAVNVNPQNGVSYTANSLFGSGLQLGTGNYVVYKGTGNTVTVSGLSFFTQYYFAVIEFNGDTTLSSYQSTPYLTNSASTLPVKWLNFKAILTDENTVQLDWSTASEINNSHFEVERLADNWEMIGRVKGNGTTNDISKYQFIDSGFKHSELNLYYRLKQVDFDGKFDYSKIAIVGLSTTKLDNSIIVFPNPNYGLFNINFTNITGNKVIKVYDAIGKLVIEAQTENKNLQLNLEGFNKGVYLVKVHTVSGILNSKLILE